MRHKSNNIKGLILILVLLAGLCLCTVASAETLSGSCGPNVTWTLDDSGKLTISGSGEMTSNPWISYKNTIKTVIIENGITSISDYSFRNCSTLTSITIPSSVKTIGSGVFQECSSLPSIIVPTTVTKFGDALFRRCTALKTVSFQAPIDSTRLLPALFLDCPNLTSINIPSNHQTYSSKDGIVFDKAGKALICYPAGKKGSYSIPSSVTKIGSSAFVGCPYLTSITIPNSVQEIGLGAFVGCNSLTSITIPGNVNIIRDGAFYQCNGLTSVTVSEGVKKIPNDCFTGCSSLKTIKLPHSLESIGADAFASCPIAQVTLHGNIHSIGAGAFEGTVSIIAPEGSYAAQWAQSNGHELTVAEPEYNISIQYAKDKGTASASPTCGTKGTKVTLKASPKKGFLFSGWTVVSGGVKIENNQFKIGTSDVVIKAKFKKDPSYACIKGAEYKLNTKKKTAKYLNPTNKTKTSITIPATITVDGVKYQVTEIASNAFKGCSKLKKVTIGKNITRIDKNAFKDCKKLATITIKTTKLTKKGIGSSSFKNIASKPTFKCPKKQKNNYKTWILKTGKAPKKSKFK